VGHGTGPLPPPADGERAWNPGVVPPIMARGVPVRFANPGAKREVPKERVEAGAPGNISLGQTFRGPGTPAGGGPATVVGAAPVINQNQNAPGTPVVIAGQPATAPIPAPVGNVPTSTGKSKA